MAGGSEEGLVRGSSPACAGRGGGGRPLGAGGSAGGLACADGNGGGPFVAGAAASGSGAFGEGSGGDPGRRGVGGKLRRMAPFADSVGRVMGRGGGPGAWAASGGADAFCGAGA